MAPAATVEPVAATVKSEKKTAPVPPRLYSVERPPSIAEFHKRCSQTIPPQNYPRVAACSSNIPIYDLAEHCPTNLSEAQFLQDEWHDALLSGPGVLVLKNFLPKPALIDRVNSTFDSIVDSELAATSSNGGKKGDHFAASGKNSRIWNSFQKHALLDPESFVEYYSNPWLSLISEAWLGPGYRVTAQVNIVRPGGAPQVSHRDYHLGFQTAESCARYRRSMQVASQLLTLQGAVAHSDMPLESGPTRFLPFSQRFDQGFMAYRLAEFQEYFNRNWVSLPLDKGDAVFFNPALFHAAGENCSADIERSANLLQVSSAFGKTMESLDSTAMVRSCWNVLIAKYQKEGLSQQVVSVAGAIAESYPFPTNLDRRQPAPGGMAPEGEADLLLRGLEEGWTMQDVLGRLAKLKQDSLSL